MEGKDLTDNIIRNIVKEILRECKNRRIRASAAFIAYYVSLLQLDPNRELTAEFLTNRENVQSFVKYVVEMLGSKDDPKILTLRLQHEFRSYIKELDSTVNNFRRRLKMKLHPLLVDIIEQDNRNTEGQLYQKICYYITLASGLGNPLLKPVFKEALQVLTSVLDEDEIYVFPSLQNYIKQELVASLTDIVTGIRLYNKSCKKGGEGMVDLPILMEAAIVAIRTALNECIDQAVYRAKLLTRSVEKHMEIIKLSTTEWRILLNFESPDEKVSWKYRRDLAVAHRQLAKTTRVLLESVMELDRHRKILHENFNETIETLNELVIPTIYQAVSDVFPHCIHLANIWKGFQDDAIRLREIFNIFKVQAKQIFTLEFDANLEFGPSYLQSWMESNDEKFITDITDPNIIIHANSQAFTKRDLEFNGYCSWAFTNTSGTLIPAVIPLGVVEYKKKFYGFSSKMAANCFCRNPDLFIKGTIELARRWVHLIKFLNLEQRLKETLHIKTLFEKKEEQKISWVAKEIQTDTHVQETNIDYTYCWNIWDYKRALIKYKGLKNKVTKSCETDKTHQKESNHTQTYELKSTVTQTKCDNYSNTAKPLHFIYGLRGIRGNFPFVMELTEDMSFNRVSNKINDYA